MWPSSIACSNAHLGSLRCLQSLNLHMPIKGLNSTKPRIMLFSSKCQSANSLIPGESIKSPPEGIWNNLAVVVVCLPLRVCSERPPTLISTPGSKTLISEDFPTPDWPTKTQVLLLSWSCKACIPCSKVVEAVNTW